jgi:uncharacterized protein (TIGR03382 family)
MQAAINQQDTEDKQIMNTPTYPVIAGLFLITTYGSSAALADDVNCPPDLGAVTIDGNVLVAAPCRLDGTTVKGNVHLYAGGSLIARNADIDGNIQAENADYIDVIDSFVNGSIQLDDLVGDISNVTNSEINGNIQLKDNRSRLEISGNTVGADIQAFDNSGGVDISDNTVNGNLQCKSNDPAPTGANNQVSGNKEDQCANLSASSGSTDSSGSTGGSSNNNAADGNTNQATDSGGGAFGPFVLLLGFIVLLRRRTAVCQRSLRLV